MGKQRPAAAGGTTTPAELLAQAEQALAGITDPQERADAEEQLDELRNAVRAEAEAERHAALAEQEQANYRRAGHDFEAEPDGPASPPPAADPAPEAPTTTDTSGE